MTIEFPLAIGLVGAPGSGKNATAEAFIEIAAPYFEENNSPLSKVENAGFVLESQFDKAFGLFGDPGDNVWAFFNRHEREMRRRLANQSFVSAGTSVDHLAHAGIAVENLMTGLQTPQQQARLEAAQAALQNITYLMINNLRYHFAFYLPHPGSSVIVPGADDFEANYASRVDRHLMTIMGNFGLRLQSLEGTPEEKATEMLDTIKRIQENGPEIPEAVEDPGEDITENDELTDETRAVMEEADAPVPDWQPEFPTDDEPTLTE